MNIKLLTINTNSLEGNAQNQYLKYFDNYDIILTQETKFNSTLRKNNIIHKWKNIYNGNLFINDNNENRNAGVGIFIKQNGKLKDVEIIHNLTIQQRYIVLKTTNNNKVIYIHCIYAPAQYKERIDFFKQLPTNFEENSTHIVGGDFNTTINPILDSISQNVSYGSKELKEWLNTLKLIDIWRFMKNEEKGMTGPKRRNRIDYIFTTYDIAQHIKYINLKSNIGHSDHLGIEIQINTTKINIGKGYWKCPVWILQNINIQTTIKNILEEWIETKLEDTENLEKNYRLLKQKLRKHIQSQHKSIINTEKNKMKQYYENLEKAYLKFNIEPNDQNKQQVKKSRNQLKNFKESLSKKNNNKTFEQLFYQQEQHTKQFIKKVKKHTKTKTMNIEEVYSNNNTISKNQKVITEEHRKYWQTIFNTELNKEYYTNNIKKFLNNIDIKISDHQKENLDQPISIQEIQSAIQSTSNNTTPGKDGLPNEIFQLYPILWSKILHKVFENEINNKNRIFDSQNMSIIILIHKKNDPKTPSNYRPIALMNNDIKIFTKILAYRIQHILPTIISEDQAGFIKGRKITNHNILIESIKYYYKKQQKDHYITFLDFEKAYDRIEHKYLLSVLRLFNFGPKIIKTIQILYKHQRSQLLINGFLTNQSIIIGVSDREIHSHLYYLY